MALIVSLVIFVSGFVSVVYCRVRLKKQIEDNPSYKMIFKERVEYVFGFVLMLFIILTNLISLLVGLF